MRVTPTKLGGLMIIEPQAFSDPRGFFMESFHVQRYRDAGISATFVQDNISLSKHSTLRGLHFQNPRGQAKIVQVLQGEIFDVSVDIRTNSSTFGKWFGIRLTAENHRQIFIPQGFAHGFCVLSDTAIFMYKCSDYYAPEDEGGICWNDPALGIEWPVTAPILSDKDQRFPTLDDIPVDQLPTI